MLCQSGIFIGRPTCCVEVDVHTRQNGNGEHIHHSISKTLTLCPLCPCELIKMLNMFISIKFKHRV